MADLVHQPTNNGTAYVKLAQTTLRVRQTLHYSDTEPSGQRALTSTSEKTQSPQRTVRRLINLPV